MWYSHGALRNVCHLRSNLPFETWIVAVRKTGHLNQCKALLAGLDLKPDKIFEIPGKSASDNGLRNVGDMLATLAATARKIATQKLPKHLFVAASGRSSVLLCRYLRKRMKDRVYIVMVGSPKTNCSFANVLVTAKHKTLTLQPSEAPSDIRTVHGALTWHPGHEAISQHATGRTLVALIGGKNQTYRYSGRQFDTFVDELNAIMDARCIIVLSRRTTADTANQLRRMLRSDIEIIPVNDRVGYENARTAATHFVVCPDSVTMVSECATTGRPVYVPDLAILKPDHDNAKFIALSMREGYVLPFEEFDWQKSTRKLEDQASALAPGLNFSIQTWLATSHTGALSH
jgi:mitochondrial fission protein ELM1